MEVFVTTLGTQHTRLNRRIFGQNIKLITLVKKWVFLVKNQFDSLQLNTVFDVYTNVNKNECVDTVYEKMMSVYITEWKTILNRTNAIRGNGRTKLRTYRLFKSGYEVEIYCTIVLPFAHRSAIEVA